ncbi:hypothetical protein EVA_16961 [gut metagenome]|uniref:Uncharacterized protein n=1 Tax=gut metagenome TaxID=749906 RepID=J9FKH6_9ZZZZ
MSDRNFVCIEDENICSHQNRVAKKSHRNISIRIFPL